MNDRTLKCVACRRIFAWSKSEQRLAEALGLGVPLRCPACRQQQSLPPRARRATEASSRDLTERRSARRLPRLSLRHIPLGVKPLTSIITLGAAGAMFAALMAAGVLASALATWFLAITVITFCAFGLDKLSAIFGRRRLPELTLLLLSAAGGTVGAVAAMLLFRHKTAKRSFQLRLAVVFAAQCVVVVAYLLLTR